MNDYELREIEKKRAGALLLASLISARVDPQFVRGVAEALETVAKEVLQ